MKVFIFLAYLLAVTVGEPPVGNGYPSNHHHDHYANDNQRTPPSQNYGPPNPQSFGPTQDFGQARSLNTAYGPPSLNNLPQEYGPPSLRNGVSQEYGPPERTGPGFSRNSLPSSEYGIPNERLGAMDSYSAPVHSSTANSNTRISEDYGVPNQRDLSLSSPSQEYGTPFRSNPSQKYGPPNSRSSYPQQAPANSIGGTFDSSKGYSRGLPKSYSPPKSVSTFNSPSLRSSSANQYLPASRSSDPGLARDSYAPPSSNYGVPLQTSAIASSFQSPRALSSSYGVPKGSGVSDSYGPPVVEDRSSVPSQEYGVPERSNQGQGYNYESVRKALEELQNQEPANYDFGYKVNDFESGSDFGHTETRQDNRAEGSYFVLLPDGTKQTVNYEADEGGFKPRISVEAVNDGSAGYDDNAANIQTRNGPY